MKYFEVGYQVAEGVYSVNVLWANTGREELEAATETAERHAARHGYKVAYLKEIDKRQTEERVARGMPMMMIDEQAEQAHDPSFAES